MGLITEKSSINRGVRIRHKETELSKSEMEANGSSGYTMEVVHRVEAPPQRSTWQKLKARLKETFFPDDPFRQFKGQPLKHKLILGAQFFFPILQWGPEYSFRLFKSDVISGLTIASLAIPQVYMHATFI